MSHLDWSSYAVSVANATPPYPPEHDPAKAAAKRIISALYPDVTISIDSSGEVTGVASFAPEKEHTGAPGWVQGGLSATVLDFVSARIAGAALDSRIATGTLDLRYRQPVLIAGGPYEVRGSCLPTSSMTVRVRAAIMSAEGRPLVEANGLFIAVNRDDPDNVVPRTAE